LEKVGAKMKKVFIVSICSECKEPTGIIDPCKILGYNHDDFPVTNFHGELSIKETEEMRQVLIRALKKDGKIIESNYIKNDTCAMEVFFNFKDDKIMKSVKSRHRKIEDICWCVCHMEGIDIKHIQPCCEHAYEKYLDKNGHIIIEKAEKIFKNKTKEND